jgi:hypothetical protein
MKKVFIILLIMIIAIITMGQHQKQNLLQEIKCTPPRFTGIEKAVPLLIEEKFQTIDNYLAKKVTYPDEDVDFLIQGTEVVQFTVTPTGEVSNFKIVNSVSRKIDNEVINALKTTNGMWKPGYNDDKPVSMEKEISIVFKVDGINKSGFKSMAKRYYAQGTEMLFSKASPKKAIRYLDKGVNLLPSDKALLVLRGLTRYQLGNREGALNDWTRVKTLGGMESTIYLENFGDLKGYAELLTVLGE